MKEAYCSYEVSKLLKEKGFSWECRTCYEHGELKTEVCRQYTDWNSRHEVWELMSAPTHQMACAWLREVHNMHIDIDPSEGDWHPCVIELETWSAISDGNLGICDTYEDAVEAALKYALENLI